MRLYNTSELKHDTFPALLYLKSTKDKNHINKTIKDIEQSCYLLDI